MKRIRSEKDRKKQREYNKRKYWENPEEARRRVYAGRKNPRSRHLAVLAEQRSNEKNYEKYMWKRSRNSARIRKLEFNLLIEDIIIPDKCPYLGCLLTRFQGHGIVYTNASLDRIDNTKGYTKNNIEVISYLANKMKQDASWDQLKLFSQEILRRVG